MSARLGLLASALACALATLALVPAGAGGASFMVSIMQDDNQLVYGTADARERALAGMKVLGVDAVRVTASWVVIAPKTRPSDPANPRRYSRARWDPYDDLVRSATRRGIRVNLNPTAPGPRWGHAKSPRSVNQKTWKPEAREFGAFVKALGRRYSGEYRDENQGRGVLPRVSFWGLYNEPNHGGWLTPQSRRSRFVRGWVPSSPAIYRDLVVASAAALLQSGHGEDLVTLGETAPLGAPPNEDRRPLRPALFIRELFCVDRRLKAYRGRAARARDCQNVRRLGILQRLSRLAYGHHPYTKTLAPDRRDRSRDSITIANISSLPRLLDRIAERTDLIPTGLPILLTEYGYESDPPDPRNGVSPARQAAYLNEGDFLAYNNPRVFGTAQFQLLDVPPRREFPRDSREYWFTYQSGLFTETGSPKPAAFAYALPIEVRRRSGSRFTVWGQLRFVPNGSVQTAYIQFRRSGASKFETAGDPIEVASHSGFFKAVRAIPSGAAVRALWVEPDFSGARTSREVRVP